MVACPDCPLCGSPPDQNLKHLVYTCPNVKCPTFTWDPAMTPGQLRDPANQTPIEMPDLLAEDG